MALRWWRRWQSAPSQIDDPHWEALCAEAPLVAGLDPERRQQLRALSVEFLRQKTFSPVHGLQLGTSERVALAAHACLPLLRFGHEGWRGWSEIIVYPGAFRVEEGRHGAPHDMDELEVVDIGFEDREGESWQFGPMVLSWEDLEAEIRCPEPGYQLVIHEMAHKLDALDGLMDGTPPLPREWQREWARDFGQAFEALCAALEDNPDAETPIDPYAADCPEEFFAVVSEYHFTAAHVLREAMPAVAEHLERFYGAPPKLD